MMTTEKIGISKEKMSVPLALSVLARFVGHEIELIDRRIATGAPVWLLVPADRQLLQSPLWQHIRRHAPVWDSPEAAVIGFARGIEGWKRATDSWPPERVMDWLRSELTAGALPAAQLTERAVSLGIHPKRLQRSADRLGVRKQKIGFGGAWWWSLPEVDGESMNEGERGHGHQYEAI